MPLPRRRSALAALPLAALAATAALAGCTATNQQTTTLHYDPADGQDVDLGQVSVDSLLVVARAGSHGPGVLVARLTNDSSSSRTVTFSGKGSTRLQATFTVPAGSSVSVGPHQSRSATLGHVAAQPGGLISLSVASGDGAGRSVTVPVLTNTQPEYASLVPTTAPSSTATSTPSPAMTESGAATGRSSSTSIRSSASASSNLSPSTGRSVASSPAPAAGSSAAK